MYAPRNFDEHTLHELRNSLQIDQKNIIGVIAQTSNKPMDDVERKLIERTTFNSQEAKNYGLVNDIVSMPFIPAGAEIISIPESPQQQSTVMPGGAQIGYFQSYTSIFDNGIGVSIPGYV